MEASQRSKFIQGAVRREGGQGLPGFGDVGTDIEGLGGDVEAGLLRVADVLRLGA